MIGLGARLCGWVRILLSGGWRTVDGLLIVLLRLDLHGLLRFSAKQQLLHGLQAVRGGEMRLSVRKVWRGKGKTRKKWETERGPSWNYTHSTFC